MSRKPDLPERLPAQQLLENFLKEHQIVLGLGAPRIDNTQDGLLIIHKPAVLVFYQDELQKNKAN